ncbi:MAG: helix-turn-helix transcriptional regulator [Alphaproteobacteria bacterium]|nr:helix-turn-helix transcriptional regulator [Alphaproteobacteria bacterium]
MQSLSKKIKERIHEKGLSTHALEKKAGLKPSAVQNILYGRSKNPSVTIIKAIARALGCKITDLIDEDIAQPLTQQTKIPYSSLPNEEKETIDWDQNLYLQCFQEVNILLEQERVIFSREKILEIVEEIYTYSQGNSMKIPDKYFSKWLIEKTKEQLP